MDNIASGKLLTGNTYHHAPCLWYKL